MIYDVYGRTESSRIYLAKPGKIMVGCLNGVNADSCGLTLNLLNTHELQFDIYRYHDQEPTNYYDDVDILMELYVDGFGWFVIDESPAIHNDGIKEYKSVAAKSYENTLHQYDLVSFDINTASPTSREMMATDNVYSLSESSDTWYNFFRDQVLFYRDTSQHKALLDNLDKAASYQNLKQELSNYPQVIYHDWRITVPIDSGLRDGFVQMKNNASSQSEIDLWQDWIDNYDNNTGITSDSVKTLMLSYPELIKYIPVEFEKHEYIYDGESDKYVQGEEEYTAYELMELEYKRMKELSLLDLILDVSGVPGWQIGTVDNSLYPEHVDGNGSQIRLSDEVGSFEIDSQDVYSFLVTQLSGYFDCVFTFDTINNQINALRIETLGVDTKIFLGFRNVQNSVDITPAQDLFTQFTVENSDGLTISDVNFGEREIEDISYFLNTKYMSQELIDKYNTWKAYRDSQRDAYVQLSRDLNAQNEVVMEIKTRVPSDMLNISQLNSYTSLDQLEEVIDNYYALMVGILNGFIYVSTENISPPGDMNLYDTYGEYIAAMDNYIDQLYRRVDINKEATATAFVDSLYYKDYNMMKTFTVPNLVIAHNNLNLPSYENKQEYYDSYEYDFATYGDMYGLDELRYYQKMHLDSMNVKQEYSVAWENIPDTEEGNAFKSKYVEAVYTRNHNLYVKYRNGYDSVTEEIEEREDQYLDALSDYEDIQNERQELADSVNIRTFTNSGNTPYFTDDEIEQISRLYRHTDYVNDNITYLNNIDSTSTLIDKQLEMLKEGFNELYAESHPQYIYTTSIDDLLSNNEYESYHPDFNVGNFVRLGLDDETQVKLRITSIQFNPMNYDNNLQITFSNMVRYLGKRNDFQSLLDSALSSAKNAISARYSRSADSNSTVQVTYDLIQKIMQSSPFTAMSQNIQAGSVNAATGTFNSLAAGYIKTDELSARVGEIETLYSDSAFVNYLNSNLVVANAIQAQSADIADLATESLSARSIDANNIDTSNLTAESAFMQYLSANLITAGEIDVDDLKAKLATINTLEADSAFVGYLTNLASSTATATIDSAYITGIVAQNMTVSDLQAGDIVLSDQMRILSQSNATEGMVMSGSEMQFLDGNGNVAISIGYNTISDGQGGTTVDYDHPSIIIKDSNGSIMLNSSGLSQNDVGIAQMIQSHTVDENKLTFNFVKTANGEIVVQNYDGTANTWGNVLTEYLNDITDKLELPSPTDIDIFYAKSDSNAVAPTSGWSTNAPLWESGKHVWEKVVTLYEDNSSRTTTPTCIQPTGAVFTSISEQYYKSTSDTAQTGGEWTTTKPTWESGYYIWTRSAITWEDESVTYSTPVLSTPDLSVYTSTINTINNIATQDANGRWALTEGVMSNTYVYTDEEHTNPIALNEFASSITTTTNGISARVAENHLSVVGMIQDEEAKRKAMYGTSSTGSATIVKSVDCDNFELYPGAVISVEFENANTAQSPTLNVNSTGAKPIKSYKDEVLTEEEYSWKAGSILDFVYDGISWRLCDNGMNLRVSTAESQINVNAGNIELKVSKDGIISSINQSPEEILIDASRVHITGDLLVGSLSDLGWAVEDNDVTYINGGSIYTGSITASQLAADAIKSLNYKEPTSGSSPYSVDGTFINLANGDIITKNFVVDNENGNAYLTGTIETGAGHIGGFTITENSIYSVMSSIDDEVDYDNINDNDSIYIEALDYYVLDENDYLTGNISPVLYGVYIGTDGIALGRGRFKVEANGHLFANSATIIGDITATSGKFGLDNGYYEIDTNGLIGYKPGVEYYFQMIGLLNGIEFDDDSVTITDLSVETTEGTYSHSDILLLDGVISIGLRYDHGTPYATIEVEESIPIASLFEGDITNITCAYTYEVNEVSNTGSESIAAYIGTNTPLTNTVEMISGTELGYDYLKTDRLIAADGLAITDGTNTLAIYGSETILGIDGSSRFVLSPNGIHYTNSIGTEIYSLTRNLNQRTIMEKHIQLKSYHTNSDVVAESLPRHTDVDASSETDAYIELTINNKTDRLDSDGISINVIDSVGVDVAISSDGVNDIVEAMSYQSSEIGYVLSEDESFDINKTYYEKLDDEYTELVLNPVDNGWYDGIISYTLSEDTTINTSKTYYVQEGIEYTIVNYSPVANGWFEYKENYALSEDTAVISNKIYYEESSGDYTVINLNPSNNGWYELLEEYVLSDDVTVDANKTYYEYTDASSYVVIQPTGNENPSIEGWYEFLSLYVASSDTNVVSSKSYYKEENSIYSIIDLNPQSNGWYEKFDYSLSEDVIYNNNKTYYQQDDLQYIIVNSNPVDNVWYEADITYESSEDTVYNPDKIYYQKDDFTYNIVNTSPLYNSWYEYFENPVTRYYPCDISVCYVASVSTSGILTLSGNINVDSAGYSVQITNNQWSDSSGTDTMMRTTNAITGISSCYGVGSGGYNHGIWSSKLANWIIYADQNGDVRIPSNSTYITGVNIGSAIIGNNLQISTTGLLTGTSATFSGSITVANNSDNGAAVHVSHNGRMIALHSNKYGTRGLYDNYIKNWLIYSPTSGQAYIPQPLNVTGAIHASNTAGDNYIMVSSGSGNIYMHSYKDGSKNRGIYAQNASKQGVTILTVNPSNVVDIPCKPKLSGGVNGNVLAVSSGAEVDVIARSTAGQIYLYAGGTASGYRGIYGNIAGLGANSGHYFMYADQSKNVYIPQPLYTGNTFNTDGQYHLGNEYKDAVHLSTVWSDGKYHDIITRNGSTNDVYVGGSKDIANVTTRTYIRGDTVKLNNSSGATIGSDRNIKRDISEYDSKYDDFYDALNPVTYKYINGSSGRTHCGFISQDVRDALLSSGLSTSDFGGYILNKITAREIDTDGTSLKTSDTNYLLDHGINEIHELIYSEFIALNTWQVQKLKARVAQLEKELEEIKRKIQ